MWIGAFGRALAIVPAVDVSAADVGNTRNGLVHNLEIPKFEFGDFLALSSADFFL